MGRHAGRPGQPPHCVRSRLGSCMSIYSLAGWTLQDWWGPGEGKREEVMEAAMGGWVDGKEGKGRGKMGECCCFWDHKRQGKRVNQPAATEGE